MIALSELFEDIFLVLLRSLYSEVDTGVRC